MKRAAVCALAALVLGWPSLSARANQSADDEVFSVGRGIDPPVPVKTVKPKYTEEGRKAKIEGFVVLRAVVRKDGTVDAVAVERSLDAKFGLDDAAIDAARQWIFEPARRQRDKHAVAVRVTIEMQFSL